MKQWTKEGTEIKWHMDKICKKKKRRRQDCLMKRLHRRQNLSKKMRRKIFLIEV